MDEIKLELQKLSSERSALSTKIKGSDQTPSTDLRNHRLRREYLGKRIEALRSEQKSLMEEGKALRQKLNTNAKGVKADRKKH